MRRIIYISFVLFIVCVSLISFVLSKKIELPFSVEEVKSIEVYHYSMPSEAQQKVITQVEDIQSIYELLTTIQVQKNRVKPMTGITTTSFRFNLFDEATLEVIYCSSGVKSGEIKSSYVFDYQTTADIENVWINMQSYEAIHVNEDTLPTYEQ